MKSVIVLSSALFALSSIAAPASEKNVFSPSQCEFSTTFPMAPDVGPHRDPHSGRQFLQATSPGDGFPWLIAQCSIGDDGSAPPDVRDRLQRVRSSINAPAAAIHSSTRKDLRGEWAIATADLDIHGIPVTMTTASIAGSKSMLLLTVVQNRSSDHSLADGFFASVTRHPYGQ